MFILDSFIVGARSCAAPVPVLRTGRHRQQTGDAANVAMNLAGLGARMTVIGFGGGDANQYVLEARLDTTGVKFSILACPGTPTTSKPRVPAGHQQLLRMDCGGKPAYTATASEILYVV